MALYERTREIRSGTPSATTCSSSTGRCSAPCARAATSPTTSTSTPRTSRGTAPVRRPPRSCQEIALSAGRGTASTCECRAATLHMPRPGAPGVPHRPLPHLLRRRRSAPLPVRDRRVDRRARAGLGRAAARSTSRAAAALVPANAEQLVEHLYGADWRRPKPGFNWNLDRTDSAPEGLMTTAMRTKVYWANFYARTELQRRLDLLRVRRRAREDTPATVIDIGCGDGRDACAFGAAGRTVLGLDQSRGRHRARDRARRGSSASRSGSAFEACDVADVDDLGRALDLAAGDSRRADAVLPALLPARDPRGRAGAADGARSTRTPARGHASRRSSAPTRTRRPAKVHTKPLPALPERHGLQRDPARACGFTIVHEEEGTGLSPYQRRGPGAVPRDRAPLRSDGRVAHVTSAAVHTPGARGVRLGVAID